jgi:hypothetical protein
VLVIALAVVGGFALVHRLEGTRPVAGTADVRNGQVPRAKKVVPLRPRSRISVLVLNGNGISGAAGTVATRLLAHGYRHAAATDAPRSDYARSVVLFRPGWGPEAGRLRRETHARLVTALDGRLPASDAGYQLVLILGAN